MKTLKINSKNSIVAKKGIYLLSPALAVMSTIILIVAQYCFNILGGGSTILSTVLMSSLVVGVTICFANSLELLLIPLAVSMINSIIRSSFLSIGFLLTVLLFVAILLDILNVLDQKYLKIAAIIYAIANAVFMIIDIIKLQLTPPIIINSIGCLLMYFAVMVAILNSNLQPKQDGKSIEINKIIKAGIIVIICVALFFAVSAKSIDTSFSKDCGHESCKENGPFPCYGKNNTCTNTTNCYKDLYCDECD